MNCDETFNAGICYVTDAYKRVCEFNGELHADLEKYRAENAKLRKLVQDFDKCLTEAVRLAYIQGHATIYDGTLLDSLHPRMRKLGVEMNDQRNIVGTTDELLPCPFCGGNCICVNVGIYVGKSHESVTIKCDDCGASIWGATEEKAIAAWNRRVQ